MQINRKTLRTQVRDILLERIQKGEVPWGEGINEVKLSTELGVSRTPLREALIELAAAGYIYNHETQGFFYLEFNAAELREVAPVIAALEALAIRLTPAEKVMSIGNRLIKVAKTFNDNSASHDILMEKDDEWHGLMLSGCPNEFLITQISAIRETFHRYESMLVASSSTVSRAAEEHLLIAESMRSGNLELTSQALMTNWVNGASRIIKLTKLQKI